MMSKRTPEPPQQKIIRVREGEPFTPQGMWRLVGTEDVPVSGTTTTERIYTLALEVKS